MQAVAAAIRQFPHQPPRLPQCPVTVLSVARADRERERQLAANREHQHRYASSLPDGRYEVVDSAHLIQAEQPQLLATRIQELCQAAAT
jgi:hypothetical protein